MRNKKQHVYIVLRFDDDYTRVIGVYNNEDAAIKKSMRCYQRDKLDDFTTYGIIKKSVKGLPNG